MPLIRPNKLPPPPELGDKTFWDYFPRQSVRRIFFLLLALGAVLILKHSGSWTFGGLFGGAQKAAPSAPTSSPVYHIKVTRPEAAPPRAPDSPAGPSQP
jgi:hypothetical protein